MKAPYQNSWLNCALFCINTFVICFSHSGFASASSACVLNLSAYQPSGACISGNKNINLWGSIPSNLCCENRLIAFSQGLAENAVRGSGDVFINYDSWKACANSTFSSSSCGFQDFYYGSTSSSCSCLSLSEIKFDAGYKDAVSICSQLDSTFDTACKTCTDAILSLTENQNTQVNDTEKAVCTFAIVTAVAAARLNDSSSFYRCMSSLNQYDPGYIELKSNVARAVAAIVVAFFILMLILVLIKYVTWSKKKSMEKLPKLVLERQESTAFWPGIYRFSKAEIESAINFNGEKKCLGRGSAGKVYKGVLPSGQVVAVKHIYRSSSSDSFTREVERLSQIRHSNLVSLIGYCYEGSEQYLVYEFCSEGNLAQHLLRKDSALTWEKRVIILRECARALRYLHLHIDGCIVHRDIKLTNILLNEKLDPKLSDFGLAKLLGIEESKVFTEVRGTIGYMDPEYMINAKLTTASDIYSFGIVILQILSGQKVIELGFNDRDQLTRKARDVLKDRPLIDFIDSRISGSVNTADFVSILKVAVNCVLKSSKGRPPITELYDVIDKASKNTDTKANKETSTSAVSMSGSLEVNPV